MRRLILLAWWFAVSDVVVSSAGHGRMVGPFTSEEQCNYVRAQMEGTYSYTAAKEKRYSRSTTCWSDGKP